MDARTYLRAILGDEAGDKAADAMADAMGRTLDEAVFYGTHATTPPIQENEMNEAQITEVSATVDAGLSQEDLDGMNEAERLALVVGSAYGQALAERDKARAALAKAVTLLNETIPTLRATSWAQDEAVADSVQTFLDALGTVDSTQAPTQED